MKKYNALDYWGKLAIKLTEENIELKEQLLRLSIEEKMRILADNPPETIKDVLEIENEEKK